MSDFHSAQDTGHWDYIVVGAGSAGSVVAARLSENPGTRVLLLESGPPDSLLLKAFGLGYYFDLSRYEWGYWSEPDLTRNGRSDHWRRGRVVGGTGSINGMNYVRGTRSDYDRWAAMGNIGWSADDVMPLFRALERVELPFEHHPDTTIRGTTGPVPVREVRQCHPLTGAFLASAEAAGYARTPDYNGTRQEGVGRGQFNQIRGFRRTSADVILKPALRRKNLELFTCAHVQKLIIKDGKVSDIIFDRAGTLCRARPQRVVLCGGAINTPQILMLSGIGDPKDLVPLGIEPKLERRRVGKNLMEHPLIRTAFRASLPTYNPTEGLLQKVGFLAKFLFSGQGPIATPAEAQAFLRSRPEEPEPDVQIHFAPLAAVFAKERTNFYKGVTILPYPSFSIHINKSHPKSRGTVRLTSADPHIAPQIHPNLLGDVEDVETLVRSILLLRRIVSEKPLADMITEHVDPQLGLVTHDELVDYVRNTTSLAYHPAGTCSMGTSDDDVVTPGLKMRGLDNLWIADASVMPDLISGNINAACMMIGEKIGRQLRDS
ncbi:hypothetical protein ASE04_18120 [Rhizobium sp. Root708]|uniref:GMC family oxidoreductase n=1 Tax=Rhizobium sp. Root708 TaxID=1736592 RepID=UPI0006F4133A|nr:GMC family oxidoreductase N-terminal domain-containing protein [Rhizobium sp. Root708]KRB49103.1 hypothetical protein ASE04_18120 [Rhizobium sp. Root708]